MPAVTRKKSATLTAVAETPNAIGYVSLFSVKDTVKAIGVGSVAPGEEAIKEGSHAVQRPFALVTEEGTQLIKTAQAFFDFTSPAVANEILTAAGSEGSAADQCCYEDDYRYGAYR